MSLAAALLAGLAVRLRWPDGRSWVRSRLDDVPPQLSPGGVLAAGLAAGAVVVPWVPRPSGPGVVVASTTAGVAWFAVVQVRRARALRRAAARRAEVGELVGLMAAELRAGVLPQRMVEGLAAEFPVLAPVARAAALGGDVPGALREASSPPGRGLLRDVAGAWSVSERSGAPLAVVVERLGQSARTEREIVREVESGVAPARATGRLMAALPVMGLLLGSGMGGDPVAVLTGTWLGAGCLAAGCALACTGVVWIERLASSAGAG
jgi:tight adherence protein B